MATFLDLGLLESMNAIFPFILVWTLTYAILQWRKLLGDNQSIHAIIAFLLGIMTLFSPRVTALIQCMAPWFTMLLVFIVFLVLFLSFFGVSDDAIAHAFTKGEDARFLIYWVIVISLLVLVAAMGQVFFSGESVYVGGQVIETTSILEARDAGVATGSGEVNFVATLFHPKILGMLFILLVATFTIKMLAGDVSSRNKSG